MIVTAPVSDGDDAGPRVRILEPLALDWRVTEILMEGGGDAKRDRGTHAREAVDEHAEEGAVAKADNRGDINAVEQRARLLRGEHRGFAGLDDVLRAATELAGLNGRTWCSRRRWHA